MAAPEAPVDGPAVLPVVDRVILSIKNIFEIAIMDDGRVGDLTLHGLDGLGSLMQGLEFPYDYFVQGLQPHILLDGIDGKALPAVIKRLPHCPTAADLPLNSSLSIYVFFQEAFGKEGAPVYLYGIRPKTPGQVFKSSEDIRTALAVFEDQKELLSMKFSKIFHITFTVTHAPYDPTPFTAHSHLLKFFADYGVFNAQYYYGQMLFMGDGVDKDNREAIRYFEMALSGGHPKAGPLLAVARKVLASSLAMDEMD